MNKKSARLRRAKKTRLNIDVNGKPRVTITRSNKHIHAQIIEKNADGSKVLAYASSVEIKEEKKTKTDIATEVGVKLAQRAKDAGVKAVAFDRSGYKYHGRVRALAEAAREGGMDF